MTMPTTPDSPAAVEYLAERMALDSGVRWRDMLNSDRNAWRYRAHKARHDANVKMPLNRPMCACFPGTCRGGQVVNGRLASGQCCKAQVPAARPNQR